MQKKDVTPVVHSQTVIEPVSFDPSTASAEFVISTDSRDRDGDVLIPDGCLPLLHTYHANPVVLFDHGQTWPLPIGLSEVPDTRTSTIRIEKNRIIGKVYFHCETLESSQVCRLVDRKVLRAASIGFRGIQYEPIDPRKPKAGMLHTQWEMLEWSVVPIGANQDALRMALSMKWEGKQLAEPIAKRFKSLLLPSKKLILPAMERVKVQSTSKRIKAMADETIEQTTEEIADESATLPAGAQGINILLEGMKQTMEAVKEAVPSIENPQVLKLIDKFLAKGDSLLKEVQSGASSIYPDIFTEGGEIETTDEEEETEETIEPDDEQPEEKTDDVDADDEEKEDDVSNAEKSFRFSKSYQKEASTHQQSVSDAAELVDEMSKSENIPSSYKRQCKGVLPGLKSASAFLSNKSETAEETKAEDDAEEKTEDTENEKEVSEEEEKAALAELKKLSTIVRSNARQLAGLKGAK